jgi:hypothetical protein
MNPSYVYFLKFYDSFEWNKPTFKCDNYFANESATAIV